MASIEIIEAPWDARVWMARTDASACRLLASSPMEPEPLEAQAWAMAADLLEDSGPGELVIRTFPDTARRLAESYAEADPSLGRPVRFEVERGTGWEPSPEIDAIVREADARREALGEIRDGDPMLGRIGRASFAIRASGQGWRDAASGLIDAASSTGGLAIVDAVPFKDGRSESMKLLAGTGGDAAASLVERLSSITRGGTRGVRFVLETGDARMPLVAVTASPDGKAFIEDPVREPLARMAQGFAEATRGEDPRFLLVEDGTERELSFSDVAEAREAWGERVASGAGTLVQAFSERASLFGRTVGIIPLDADGIRLGARIDFHPDGTRGVSADPLLGEAFGTAPAASVEDARSSSRLPAPAVEGIACCAEAEMVGIGAARSALPSVVVGRDHPLLPERAGALRAGTGSAPLAASQSMQAVLLHERLRAIRPGMDGYSDLLRLSEACVPGVALASPTAMESRLLAAAARAAAEAERGGRPYAEGFEDKVSLLRAEGLLPPRSSRLSVGSRVRESALASPGIGAMDAATHASLAEAMERPALVVLPSASIMPQRRIVSIPRAGGGFGPPGEQILVSALAAHFLSKELPSSIQAELADAGRRAASEGAIVVAPTRGEAAVLRAAMSSAASVAASGRPAAFASELRGELRRLASKGELPCGVAITGARAEDSGPRVPLRDGWKVGGEVPGMATASAARLARAAAGEVLLAHRSGQAPASARLRLSLDEEGRLMTASGSVVGRVSELGALDGPVGKALDEGRTLSLRASDVLDAAAPGWTLAAGPSKDIEAVLPKPSARTLRFSIEDLASRADHRLEGGARFLSASSLVRIAAFQEQAGIVAEAHLKASGLAIDLGAFGEAAGVLPPRAAEDLRMEAGTWAVLSASLALSGEASPAVRDRLSRDEESVRRSFAGRWGVSPGEILAPVLLPSMADGDFQTRLRDGARLSSLDALVAAERLLRSDEPIGPAACAMLGKGDAGEAGLLADAARTRIMALLPEGADAPSRLAVEASARRMAALAALSSADPGRFVEPAFHAEAIERASLSIACGIEAPRHREDREASLTAAAARALLADRQASGRIGRDELSSALSSVLAESASSGQRPAVIAASASGLGSIERGRLSNAAIADADRLRAALAASDVPDAQARAVDRHISEREVLKGFALPGDREERLLRGWALDLHARTKAPSPFPETLDALIEASRTRPLDAADVEALAGTAEMAGRAEGKPARTMVFEAARRSADRIEADAVISGAQVKKGALHAALGDAAREAGEEEWKALRAAGSSPPEGIRDAVGRRSLLSALVKATEALRPDGTRAISADAELAVRRSLSESVKARTGVGIEALGRTMAEEGRVAKDAGMGR
ncbi:hypothetical protein WV31_10260 [Magnetospirillum sp. ME-1]|uniref:hypothetical protein n=1 Tax=Magnetospirillum sp. ME-1 TaxID=1639348 RepID=UPI000A17BE85|nr:hypothetical protein [Magnetospirillum sp. ME-1]ARJ66009.1 hypothetical protein WV31_10260 [Magnetospirillum sp. ME-1]